MDVRGVNLGTILSMHEAESAMLYFRGLVYELELDVDCVEIHVQSQWLMSSR